VVATRCVFPMFISYSSLCRDSAHNGGYCGHRLGFGRYRQCRRVLCVMLSVSWYRSSDYGGGEGGGFWRINSKRYDTIKQWNITADADKYFPYLYCRFEGHFCSTIAILTHKISHLKTSTPASVQCTGTFNHSHAPRLGALRDRKIRLTELQIKNLQLLQEIALNWSVIEGRKEKLLNEFIWSLRNIIIVLW
jgi:hypothetical protein